MAEIRRVEMTLRLILLLQVAAMTEQLFQIFKEAEDANLPCEKVKNNRDNCDDIIWKYKASERGREEDLFGRGSVYKSDVGAESKSDRLSLVANCSLLVKRVRVEDAGRYSCRKLNDSLKSGEDLFYLGVLSMTELWSDGEATLRCSLSTYKQCNHTVKWLLGSKDAELDQSLSQCSASVTVEASPRDNGSVTCEVTRDRGKKEQFTFERKRPSGWGLHAVGFLCSAALLITAVAAVVFVRRRRSRGDKTKSEENVAEPDDGVSYASVTYSRKPNNTDKVWGGDRVTYSAVKPSSSSSQADPCSLYAVINKTSKQPRDAN